MALPTGSHKLGPDSASLQVKTYREGMASKVGHDLVIAFTRWEATVGIAGDPASSTVELSADSRSLEVREGLRGIKPYRGLMGALKVRDELEIVIDARLPAR